MLGEQIYLCPPHFCLNSVHQRKLHHLLPLGALEVQVPQIGNSHFYFYFLNFRKFALLVNKCMCNLLQISCDDFSIFFSIGFITCLGKSMCYVSTT